MPSVQPLSVTLKTPQGMENRAELSLRTWERADGVRKGLIWGGAIAAVGFLMVPIPLIHFFAPIVILLMAPLGGFLIFRMHAGGEDLAGEAVCPDCGAGLVVGGSAERFPVSRICYGCKSSITISPATALKE